MPLEVSPKGVQKLTINKGRVSIKSHPIHLTLLHLVAATQLEGDRINSKAGITEPEPALSSGELTGKKDDVA